MKSVSNSALTQSAQMYQGGIKTVLKDLEDFVARTARMIS